jgi:hypothetical protein
MQVEPFTILTGAASLHRQHNPFIRLVDFEHLGTREYNLISCLLGNRINMAPKFQKGPDLKRFMVSFCRPKWRCCLNLCCGRSHAIV